jgi:sec-independent protein translocase protein TatB
MVVIARVWWGWLSGVWRSPYHGATMPSFQDSAVIFVIALLLFGPKKLPELARQLGKLMGEFRRASNDFRIQMEDELRMSEQADRQKEIAAMEAAAPKAIPADIYPAEEHPHLQAEVAAEASPEPLPIATSGELQMMPPATGLPIGRGAVEEDGAALSPLLDSLPEAPEYSENTIHAPTGAGAMQADHHG